ncbi:signal recognition particle-docking protein FtsY [Desulfoplanes formicivorans]|uniref:Signal recognition particle receptor FtsY n=1 Tax=Desulfoplanes formicivorans TaxID=1592317 RepID=A0A194AJP8_9BACT|nr:signal recognition particle-docking protein FtsY [Desulfoplanes formicivorans]GAU09543.1 cell division protein FtsY [Desulfoplanes formicivorans]
MGFFSKIKKIWKKDTQDHGAVNEPASVDKATDAAIDSQPQVTTIPDAAAPQTRQESSAPDHQPDEAPSFFRKLIHPQASQPEKSESGEPDAPSAQAAGDTTHGEPAGKQEPLPETFTQEKPKAPQLEPWQQDLVHALDNAEPKLSIWLTHLLTDVSERGEKLWERLHFLLAQLEVPREEADDFIDRFDRWLEDMEYERVEEFRSELQYRLALALDLEDEEDEQSRLFLKLSQGLSKTREQLSKQIDHLLSMTGSFDDEFWEELEEILIMADVGYEASHKLLERLRPKVRREDITDAQAFKDMLKAELVQIFEEARRPAKTGTPEVVLMVGVNGVGKTTTIAKLAHRAQMQGKKTLVAAGDTFRAAAIEQLNIWAKRVGAGFYAKEHGADPAAVAFEAMNMAIEQGYDQVFMDTAGRIHTKVDLMEELKKIKRVLGKKMDGAPHRTILVLDATTGQNALSQVRLFSEAVDLDEIVLTKLDGTAKGGIIVAVALEYKIPISFIGLGEQMEDLRPFSGEDFAKALLD